METKIEMEYYPRKNSNELCFESIPKLIIPGTVRKVPVVVDRKIYKNPLYKEGINPELEYICIEKKIYVKTSEWF